MPRLAPLVLTVLLIAAACQPGAPAKKPSPPPSPSASPSPALAIRPPYQDLLGPDQVGLSPVSGADHVSKELAAEQQTNQPLALNQYSAWGWVDEATRVYGSGPKHLELAILLLSSPEGAEAAFAAWADALGGRQLCPKGLALDDCALSSSAIVGRIGPYVFRLAGAGVDVIALAGEQAAAIRKPAST